MKTTARRKAVVLDIILMVGRCLQVVRAVVKSEIRRYILEADLLEAIITLPTDMFYNTGIATYVWVLSNEKRVLNVRAKYS